MTVAPMTDMPDTPQKRPWYIPPEGGFRAEDLDRIPELPPHTELIDGSLVFVSPQASFHELTMGVLVNGLRRTAPSSVRVRREMTVTLDPRQRPEPDVLVVRAEAIEGRRQTDFRPADIILAVEVVSPDSEARDRKRKPQLYAEAGIPHFWRVEDSEGRSTVCVYELDVATMAYALTGIYHDRLKLTVPFDIDIDLTEIDRL
ncbi:Uma2 family endonuclease [Actinoallomurus spadix]|uniref:Uma2 family endonuclease n=1 Tax=Actinoallomurus spadix TaxID=79912 RepID=A0ABN0X539_9ACTN|nr:Uma2 family endonuclease [Actinoallomurus spadix]MCO5986840.1 Uma2 family endonuclease [Actinoallomurus spadix]